MKEAAVSIWLRVALAATCTFFLAGIFSGFAPLKPMLYDVGVYKEACANVSHTLEQISSPQHPRCEAQAIAVNRIMQVTSGLVSFLAFPSGVLADRIGRRKSIMFGGNIAGGFWSAFSMAVYYNDAIPYAIQTYLLPFLFLVCACGGTLLYFGSMRYIIDMKTLSSAQSSMVNSLLAGCFDLSCLVPFLFNLLYFKLHLDFKQISFVFSLVTNPLLGVLMWKAYPPGCAELVSPEEEAAIRRQAWPLKQYWQIFRCNRRDVVLSWLTLAVALLTQYWYISTVLEQLMWITGSQEESLYFNNVFALFLPLFGAGPTLFLGFLLGYSAMSSSPDEQKPFLSDISAEMSPNPKSYRCYAGLTVLAAFFSLLSCIRYPPFLYFTFVVVAIWRTYTLVATFQFASEHFPQNIFATASSSGFVVAGVTVLLTNFLNPLTSYTFRGNFLPVNLTLGAVSVVLTATMTYRAWLLRHSALVDAG